MPLLKQEENYSSSESGFKLSGLTVRGNTDRKYLKDKTNHVQ